MANTALRDAGPPPRDYHATTRKTEGASTGVAADTAGGAAEGGTPAGITGVPVWEHVRTRPFQLVLEGGAMRGMFTCGVLDFLLDHGLLAESVVGVSMGASAGFSYASGVPGQTAKVVLAYRDDWRFLSLASKLATGDLVGSRFVFQTIPDELEHVPTRWYRSSPVGLVTVATDVDTGLPDYHLVAKSPRPLAPEAREREARYMMATAAVPFANRVVGVDGKRLLDGGIVQAIPYDYGRGEEGGPQGRHDYAGRQVVVLTRERGHHPGGTGADVRLARLWYRRHPQLVARMEGRAAEYERELREVERLHDAGELFAIWPEGPLPARMAERDPRRLLATYEAGLAAAARRWDELLRFLGL